MLITINGEEISYTVQYSKRKKLTLEISPEGHILIKAPLKTSKEQLEEFMLANKKLLLRLVEQEKNKKVIHVKKEYREEENFLFRGRAYTLEQLLPLLGLTSLPESKEEIQALLAKFYAKQTKALVKKRVQHFEKIIGVKAKSITIVDSKAAWGTCNNHKELTFNYRLSMACDSALDYVVIHELCHILHLNHDRSFYRKVGMYDPNYKAHEAYLSRFGIVMTI